MISALSALFVVSLAAEPVKLASPGLRVFQIDPKVATFYTEHLSTQLALRGLRVITPRDIEALLGMERQKQLLGCGEDSTQCLAELGNALGADAVLMGDLLKSGRGVQMNLKIIRATNGEPISIFAQKASSEDDVLDLLSRAAGELSSDVLKRFNRAAPESSSPSNFRSWMWAPAGVGAALLAGGAVSLGVSHSQAGRLAVGSSRLEAGAEDAIISTGRTTETLGWLGLSLGLASLAATGLLWLFLPPEEVPAASLFLAPTDLGAMVGITVRWP